MFRLSPTQRGIILAGITVIVLMGLFPPWTYTFKSPRTYSEEPAGYGFIASPPSIRADDHGYRQRWHGIKIDLSRLLVQWAVTIAAAGFGVLLAAKRNSKRDQENHSRGAPQPIVSQDKRHAKWPLRICLFLILVVAWVVVQSAWEGIKGPLIDSTYEHFREGGAGVHQAAERAAILAGIIKGSLIVVFIGLGTIIWRKTRG